MNLFIGVVGGHRQEIKRKEEKMTALMEEWVRERDSEMKWTGRSKGVKCWARAVEGGKESGEVERRRGGKKKKEEKENEERRRWGKKKRKEQDE